MSAVHEPEHDQDEQADPAATDAAAVIRQQDLARALAGVLADLDEAGRDGAAAQAAGCHAQADHLMAELAEADEVRHGVRDRTAGLDCAACGSVAEPVIDTQLVGWRCPVCSWHGEEPAVHDQRRRAKAADALIDACATALTGLDAALDDLGHRDKRRRQQAITRLSDLRTELTTAHSRVVQADQH